MFSIQISVDPKEMDEFEAELEVQIQARMQDFAENIEWAIRSKASNVLDSTKSRYLSALHVEKSGDYEVSVSLNDPLASAIESGSEPRQLPFKGPTKIAKDGGGTVVRQAPFRSKNPVFVYTPKRGSTGDPPWYHPGIGKGPNSKLFQMGTPIQQVTKELDSIIDETFSDLFKGSE